MTQRVITAFPFELTHQFFRTEKSLYSKQLFAVAYNCEYIDFLVRR